jgi:hypothetical protein
MTREELQKRRRKKVEREGSMTAEEVGRRLAEMCRKKKEEGEPRTS